MPGAPSSVRTLLVAMPFPPSSVFAPSIVRIRPAVGSPSVLDRRGDTPEDGLHGRRPGVHRGHGRGRPRGFGERVSSVLEPGMERFCCGMFL